MIEALSTGGDIHSRTAYRMFDEVRKAVDSGQVRLHESSSGGNSKAPLVKQRFAEQRRLAKAMNFGLLYGQTARGFSKAWDIPLAEAEAYIDRWHASFPEVATWKSIAECAAEDGGARTLLGRARPLPDLRSKRWDLQGHARRAAINSPVQGSAADIVIAAMVALHTSGELRRLRYQQVLQIHDEVILEGPQEHAGEALREVVRIMEDPLFFPLKAPLRVDARRAQAWLSAGP